MKSEIIGGELVAQQLKKENINTVFALIGNHVSPILVHLNDYGIKIIHTRHEQGAVHMADGWAQTTHKPGVVIVCGGPGFSNTFTGIIKAYFAQTPLVIIAGAHVTNTRDTGGVQDLDQLSIIRPYTKWARTVYDAKRIPEYIGRALQIASEGRKGPVVLEMPTNVLRQVVGEDVPEYSCNLLSCNVTLPSAEAIDKFIDIISHSQKPIIIAGDEIYYNHAEKKLNEFVNLTQIPIFTVNKARGSVADTHPLCMGSGRTFEGGPQLYAYQNADTVIIIGVENDYQMNQFKPPAFSGKQRFISVSRDINRILITDLRPELVLEGNTDKVLEQMNRRLQEIPLQCDFSEWLSQLKESKSKFWDVLRTENEDRNGAYVNPLNCIMEIQKLIDKDAIIVLDGSNAMFWGAACFQCNCPGQLVIAPDGSYGPIGTGVSIAIGVKAANPDKEVVLYTGDGSFGFNAMEMDTAVRFNLPIIVFIHNDEAWGFCKTTQQMLFDKTSAADLGTVRYDEMVKALGGYGELVTDLNFLRDSIIRAKESKLPACINIMMDKDALSPGTKYLNSLVKFKQNY